MHCSTCFDIDVNGCVWGLEETWFHHTIWERNRWIFPSRSWMKKKNIQYVITFHRHRHGLVRNSMCTHDTGGFNAKEINVCVQEGKNHLSCSSWEAGPTSIWYWETAHHSKDCRKHAHPHTNTLSLSPSLSLPLPSQRQICGICNACVRLCRNIFFILINCKGAIYFPLRRWRWLVVRVTLVGADKLLLRRRPAGGTRFTRKTMSTRSDAHMHKTTGTCAHSFV